MLGAGGGLVWLIASKRSDSSTILPYGGERLVGKLSLEPDWDDEEDEGEGEVNEGYWIIFEGEAVGKLYRFDYDADAWRSQRFLADESAMVGPVFRGPGAQRKALDWMRAESYEATTEAEEE